MFLITRINLTIYRLNEVLEGDMQNIAILFYKEHQADQLAALAQAAQLIMQSAYTVESALKSAIVQLQEGVAHIALDWCCGTAATP